jgi:hypothetical protein
MRQNNVLKESSSAVTRSKETSITELSLKRIGYLEFYIIKEIVTSLIYFN